VQFVKVAHLAQMQGDAEQATVEPFQEHQGLLWVQSITLLTR
jgi:hypothetical protein